MTIDKGALEAAIFSAIFDPGGEVGMKHDRSLNAPAQLTGKPE